VVAPHVGPEESHPFVGDDVREIILEKEVIFRIFKEI